MATLTLVKIAAEPENGALSEALRSKPKIRVFILAGPRPCVQDDIVLGECRET